MRIAIAALAVATTFSLPARADYFLDAHQKAELVSHGQITGQDGALYNVWIVPGYVGPGQDVVAGWRQAGDDMAEYGDGKTYQNALRHSRDTFRFAHKDILREFAFKGTGRTWRESFSTAAVRVDKRVFGWWFAYPWAFLEATGVSALRVGVGVPTGVAVGAGSVSVLPLVELSLPMLKAGYHSTVDGTALPLVAASWNTVIAPPLALLGEQPSPERADGFWMKRIDPATSDTRLLATLQALSAWRDQQLASAPAQAVTVAQAAEEQAFRARREALLRELAKEQLDRHDAAEARLLAVLRAAATAPDAPAAETLRALAQQHGRQPLVNALRGEALDEAAASALLDVLLGGSPVPLQEPPALRPDKEKTDPLRRSFELMKD